MQTKANVWRGFTLCPWQRGPVPVVLWLAEELWAPAGRTSAEGG
jgi:hypothetical protein